MGRGTHRGFITYEELNKSLGKRNLSDENLAQAFIHILDENITLVEKKSDFKAIKKRDILLAVGVSLLSPGLYLLGAIGSSKLFWETLDIILKENNNEKFYYPRQVSNGYVKDNTKGCIEIQTLSLPIVRNDVSNSNINFTLFWNRIWLLSQILFSRL